MFTRDEHGGIVLLRMAHGKVSALDAGFCAAMRDELDTLARDAGTRAVILTGTGSAFSAGVDLFQLLEGGADYVRRFLPLLDQFLRALLVFPKPLVAAVNGHAIAGGCIIAATADYRLLAKGTARIGVPELAVGVPFPRLPLEIVSARVSPTMLRALVYTGRTVLPDEALAAGFVDEIVDADALVPRATAIAQQFSAIPASTFRLTKAAFADAVLDRVRAAPESTASVVEAWASGDVQQAVRRYLEKTLKK